MIRSVTVIVLTSVQDVIARSENPWIITFTGYSDLNPAFSRPSLSPKNVNFEMLTYFPNLTNAHSLVLQLIPIGPDVDFDFICIAAYA